MKRLGITKKLFIFLISAVSILFFNCAIITNFLSASADSSYSSYYGKNTVSITNSNFKNYNKNSNKLPYAPKDGWTVIQENSSVVAGIIDTSATTFADNDNYTLEANPSTYTPSFDNYILAIKSDSNAQYGFKSESIELAANKYYVLTVYCKTGLRNAQNELLAGTNGNASIYTSLSDTQCFESINTNGVWNTYSIYFATDVYNKTNFEVELRIGNKTDGSSGNVFFDNLEIKEIANTDFYSAQQNASDLTQKFINLNRNSEAGFTNSSFANNLTGWEVLQGDANITTPSFDSINQTLNENENTTNKDYANNFVFDTDQKALLIFNKTKTYTEIQNAQTNFVNIKQHEFYVLSAYIKTGSLSGNGLNVSLFNTELDVSKLQENQTSSSGEDAFNGFTKVEFFIKGYVYKDEQVGINFALGTSDSPVSGWAIVDNITLTKISQSEYENQTSSSSNSGKIFDLNQNLKTISGIKNGSFDYVSSTQTNATYPILPESWTYSNTDSYSGIIRVEEELFNADCLNFGLTNADNPGPNLSYPVYQEVLKVNPNFSPKNENVLMVRTKQNNNSYFTSSAISLTKNSSADSNTLNKIQVGVKTLGSSKAYIKLLDSNDNVVAVINNISTSNWTNYTIYVKNGISDNSAKLVLGVEGTNAYSFFDYAKFFDSTSETLENILQDENSCYVDLINDSFYSKSNTKVYGDVYEISNWALNTSNPSLLNATYFGVASTYSNPSLNTHADAQDKNMLVVRNNVSTYQTVNSNYNYSLTANNYYEFSVWVKTDFTNIANTGNFGANFEIASVDTKTNTITKDTTNKNKFSNIVTESEDNNWVKYSIYVFAESEQTVKVLLGLGTEEDVTCGTAYFDDLTVKAISKSDYTNKKANDTTIVSKVITPDETSNEESKSSTTENTNQVNFFILFSSIILAVALVFAIAGYLIRRIPKKKLEKIAKSSYNKTPKQVNEKDIKQKLKVTRQNNIEKLESEISSLNNQLQKLQDEYKNETDKAEDDLSKKNKVYATYTKKINKVSKQIAYLESALVYLKDSANIKTMESIEIKNEKRKNKEEFLKLLEQAELEPEKKEQPKTRKKKYKINN